MTSNTSLLTRGDRLWATSQQKEENRAPWWGYNKRSAAGWYLGHPRKGEHQSDALTFQSTTIDNNSTQNGRRLALPRRVDPLWYRGRPDGKVCLRWKLWQWQRFCVRLALQSRVRPLLVLQLPQSLAPKEQSVQLTSIVLPLTYDSLSSVPKNRPLTITIHMYSNWL